MINQKTVILYSVLSIIFYIIYWNSLGHIKNLPEISIICAFIFALLSLIIAIKLQKCGKQGSLLSILKVMDIVLIIVSGIGVIGLISIVFISINTLIRG